MEQKSENTKEHVQSKYHQKCMELADNLKFTIEHPHTTIISTLDAHEADNIERNRSRLKSIASAVLFCGRQCIALQEIEKIMIHQVITETFSPY